MALERWEIDSGHSGLHFTIRHMALARVHGQFTRWSGTLTAEDGDLRRGAVHLLIDAGSIATGLEERDAHLRSADFLNVAEFPEILFHGRVADEPEGHRFRIQGDLEVLGAPHPMVFEAENTGRVIDPWGHERASFAARGELCRSAFGITWNQSLGVFGSLVEDRIAFELEAEAVLQGPAAPGRLPRRPGMIPADPQQAYGARPLPKR